MKIEVLRLNHRIGRDPRTSTHVALTARSFGATKIYYSGDKDSTLEESVNKITEKFGGPFEIEHVKDAITLIKEKKKLKFLVVHLTMYGNDFKNYKTRFKNRDLLIIVGGEKVEPEFYDLANFNLSITNQPISEVSALGVFLYDLFGYRKNIKGAKLKIIGRKKGKLLKQLRH